MPRTYRSRATRTPRLIVHDPQADDIGADEYDVDEQLGELTKKVIRRLHQEIHNYTVPQLLSGLHKCLQVRVLLVTLRDKGGGNAGASVRKYTTAFAPPSNDAGSRASGRGRRRAIAGPATDDIIDLITDED
jgi:hypothetical protein